MPHLLGRAEPQLALLRDRDLDLLVLSEPDAESRAHPSRDAGAAAKRVTLGKIAQSSNL